MPKFLTTDELYRLFQRELPADVYPDGPASAFFSTADAGAFSECVASSQSNLSRVYANYWPQTADERILDWERTVFGRNLPADLTLEDRRERVGERFRARKDLSVPSLIDIVKSVIGVDKLVDISEWGTATGGWELDESQLGILTVLGVETVGNGAIAGDDLCSKGAADFGYTAPQWADIQAAAYTYTVNIYGYTPTADELAALELDLSTFEPARSTHTIASGLDPEDLIAGPYAGGYSLIGPEGFAITSELGEILTTEPPV